MRPAAPFQSEIRPSDPIAKAPSPAPAKACSRAWSATTPGFISGSFLEGDSRPLNRRRFVGARSWPALPYHLNSGKSRARALPIRWSTFSGGCDLEEAESVRKSEARAPQWGASLSITGTVAAGLPEAGRALSCLGKGRYSNLYLRVTPTIWAV